MLLVEQMKSLTRHLKYGYNQYSVGPRLSCLFNASRDEKGRSVQVAKYGSGYIYSYSVHTSLGLLIELANVLKRKTDHPLWYVCKTQ